ncbi:limbin-like isoform X2 [Syngnathoides biaculeatus]|uniref:limbin-like isoform X2 n=1 Tax=Syngnathoides biaculeatus TaxID=300417 RepID=UPI002ADD4EFC|nr:limbin-like isoform X2 [Syngnathoides biaculeatus]
MAEKVTIWSILVHLQVSWFSPTSPSSNWCPNVILNETPGVPSPAPPSNGTCQDTCWCSTPSTNVSNKHGTICSIFETKHTVENSKGLQLHTHCKMTFHHSYCAEGPVSSSASADPWAHSFYTSLGRIRAILQLRDRRSSLTRYNPGHMLPQLQSSTPPTTFKIKFHKCAQVLAESDPPQLTFFLLIQNLSPMGGTNLSQVAIRDSIFGIVPLKTEGRVVERGYQMFAIDFLSGSQMILNYTAKIMSHKSGVLDLPSFLTFSNLSQNDVSLFGPVTANLTLRVNSTDRIHPSHGVHFAGFVGGFLVALVLLLLGFLAINLICPRPTLSVLQQNKTSSDPDTEYVDCCMTETIKDEATFEDKIVDIMVLEEPQNMNKALENLEMSTLLHATNNLEATRIQIYKDVVFVLLGGLRSCGQISVQAQQRLLSVLLGQLLGMEGRLKEERSTRMATLAGKCNLETREEMEAEHRREAAEKAHAELLCQHAEQQELLRCSVLLEKLHKLRQAHLQRILLVRHEEASAKVQRQIIEWRRVELHKIFCEELEEATKMGELDKNAANSLQYSYFHSQDLLEETLDVILANWRYVLAERHAQRKFLLHSLHSLNSIISDTFSSTSSNLDSMFTHIRRGSNMSTEQLTQLQEKTQKDLVMVRQRLDDALTQERRAMRCGLLKTRQELISDMLRAQMQRKKHLSGLSKNQDGDIQVAHHLHCWQNLLTTHSLELAELINNLDEEAAADIRKVTMRVIQTSMADVKAIQHSALQDLLTILPPGLQEALLQGDPEAGQGGSKLLQGQEMLHQEGKAALHILSTTRESLNRAMESELQEQKELRAHCRAFFRCLCSSQLTLSDNEHLGMKLEFQKCHSVMDRCLMLPHAVSRTKPHNCLTIWRKESEQQMMNPHFKGKAIHKTQETSNLVHFQKKLQDQIQVFEKEMVREMDNAVINKVKEEMREEREDYLRTQANSLAMQMAAVHYRKAQRRSKVLETSRALLTLHSMLLHHLRETKCLARQELAKIIQSHCLGLEDAQHYLLEENGELDQLETFQRSTKTHTEDADEAELFRLQQESLMSSILQEALNKCDQVKTILAVRSQEMTISSQTVGDRREQIALKRLYSTRDQDLLFASELIKQCRMSVELLLELLRLLLPTLPESELLSLTDALCPKQHFGSFPTDQDHFECNLDLPVRLKEDLVHRSMLNMPLVERERSHSLQEKRQSLMERLLPSSCLPLAVKGMEDSFMKQNLPKYKSSVNENRQQHGETPNQSNMEQENETLPSSLEEEEDMIPTLANVEVICQATGERLFVFRDPPQSHITISSSKKKRKRNFLNLKKGCVTPTAQT